MSQRAQFSLNYKNRLMKLISFDIHADFAFFRKPETNNTTNLSYNIIHRPAVLGILGAILGLDGYKEIGKLPAYYELLKTIKIGIEPLNHDKGNYSKTNIKYSNTVGYANKGDNFLTEELTLVEPSYRIYLLLDESIPEQDQLLVSIRKGQTEYIPYLGKNEFTAWWSPDTVKEYTFEQRDITESSVCIRSIFMKKSILKNETEIPVPDWLNLENDTNPFMYFERLPKDFDLSLMQYEISDFAYSNYRFKNAQNLDNMYYLKETDAYVQLF